MWTEYSPKQNTKKYNMELILHSQRRLLLMKLRLKSLSFWPLLNNVMVIKFNEWLWRYWWKFFIVKWWCVVSIEEIFVAMSKIDAVILSMLRALILIQNEKKEFWSVKGSKYSVICAWWNLQSGKILSQFVPPERRMPLMVIYIECLQYSSKSFEKLPKAIVRLDFIN